MYFVKNKICDSKSEKCLGGYESRNIKKWLRITVLDLHKYASEKILLHQEISATKVRSKFCETPPWHKSGADCDSRAVYVLHIDANLPDELIRRTRCFMAVQ